MWPGDALFMKYNFFRKNRKNRKHDLWGELQDISFAEGTLRRATAYVLCFVSFGLSILALTVNEFEGNHALRLPLLAIITVTFMGIFWLWVKKNTELGPLYLCLGSLALLGGYLLLRRSAPDGSSLFWFLLFPPMAMFCLGLSRGTVAFGVFFFFLIMLMATPMQIFLAAPLPQTVRIRFLVAMAGTFVFSWGAEYVRFQTQKALARTMARLEQDSLTDPLTKLGNRRKFYNFYNISFVGSSARKQAFSLSIADIDYFKNINDTYGHEIGDKVLCHISAILRSLCRDTDKVYRWGGEEFLIFMSKTNLSEALIALERIRLRIQEIPFVCEDGKEIFITVSFGLYEGTSNDSIEAQISEADRRLYAAKRGGRNKVAYEATSSFEDACACSPNPSQTVADKTSKKNHEKNVDCGNISRSLST